MHNFWSKQNTCVFYLLLDADIFEANYSPCIWKKVLTCERVLIFFPLHHHFLSSLTILTALSSLLPVSKRWVRKLLFKSRKADKEYKNSREWCEETHEAPSLLKLSRYGSTQFLVVCLHATFVLDTFAWYMAFGFNDKSFIHLHCFICLFRNTGSCLPLG